MTSPSPYAYVFEGGEPDTPWIALKDYKALSQLHTKYWGKPIQGNELELQTPSEGQPMDEDKDKNEDKDEDEDEDEDQPIDDDEDQSIDDDEDQSEVGSGCFTLDFDIPLLRISKLLVRQDYIRIYDYCNTHYNDVWSYSEPGRPPPSAPSVVITGQPGTGECFSC